jgi:hypothetical protein
MKIKTQYWRALAALGLSMAGGVCMAADISYHFNSGLEGWYAADNHGSLSWDNTHNRGTEQSGCLKLTMVAGTDTEIDPRVDVAYDTLGYFSVEFDMMVDPASGTDAGGIYGNLQAVDWDAAWNWHSQWYGSLGSPGGPFSTWKHVKIPFTVTYGPRVRLAFQIAAGTVPYDTDVIIYIDNVVIRDGTPPNKAMLYDYAWPEECVPDSTGGLPAQWSQDTTLHPDGAVKEVVDYGTGSTGWQDAYGEFHSPTFDPSKFTYIDFDLYLDAPAGLASYGQYQLHYWYSWAGIGTVNLAATNLGRWMHYSVPLPAGPVQGIVLHPGGNALSGVFTYYVDNVTLWKPANPPTITKLTPGSLVQGVQITMDDNTAQWQRNAIVTPSTDFPHLWTSQGIYPVSYSFTIANFPAAASHQGFEAHMYLINADTGGGISGWNATYGAADWNVPDILKFTVENAAGGGAIARISWKTNLAGANPPGDVDHNPVYATGSSVVGKWTLTFTDATSGSISGPGLSATNFTLPADAVANNFSPATDYIQFGMSKNDGANDGHNNQAHGTFGEVKQVSGGGGDFDDTFPGPLLTTTYAWRTTSSTAIAWTPPNIAYWLTWTLPDDGFSVETSGSANGWFTDAGVTYTYTIGATKVGGVPAANVPPGNAAFFRLKK